MGWNFLKSYATGSNPKEENEFSGFTYSRRKGEINFTVLCNAPLAEHEVNEAVNTTFQTLTDTPEEVRALTITNRLWKEGCNGAGVKADPDWTDITIKVWK